MQVVVQHSKHNDKLFYGWLYTETAQLYLLQPNYKQ